MSNNCCKMKLGVFFFGDRNELTGAGAVVRSFADKPNVFKLYGISEICIYDRAAISAVKSNHPSKNSLKSSIVNIVSNTAYGAAKLIDKLYCAKGREVVDSYFLNSKCDEDVLIFHEIFTCIAYNSRCSKQGIPPKPYILVLHNNGEVFKMLRIYYPKFANSRYERKMEEKVVNCLENAYNIVFVTHIAVDNFSILYPQYKQKARVVYNGISNLNLEYNPIFDGRIRMVTVGTVNARKNQKMIIESMNMLRNPNLYLTVIGGGDCLDECKNLVVKYGLQSKVCFKGPRKDVDILLKDANLFVMSSLDEGLPISAIEGLRAKLPLILTDVGGNKELIEDNGFLICPNRESLCNALVCFESNTETQREMSAKSHQLFCDKFTVEKMILEYCKLFKLMNK